MEVHSYKHPTKKLIKSFVIVTWKPRTRDWKGNRKGREKGGDLRVEIADVGGGVLVPLGRVLPQQVRTDSRCDSRRHLRRRRSPEIWRRCRPGSGLLGEPGVGDGPAFGSILAQVRVGGVNWAL